MAWVKWKDGSLLQNTLHKKQGAGGDWKEVFDEVDSTAVDKKIVIVEENGKLYRRTEDIAFTYGQKREKEYPHVKEQLDMIYKDQVNGTTTWKDKIAEIKEKYPKE